MDEEIETLVVRVRADTQGLSRDVEAMRAGIEGPLGDGAERAGRRRWASMSFGRYPMNCSTRIAGTTGSSGRRMATRR